MAFRDAVPRMLHLPGFMVKSCDEVVQEMARSLPPGSLSSRERALFLGRAAAPGDVAANRETSDRRPCPCPRCPMGAESLSESAVGASPLR